MLNEYLSGVAGGIAVVCVGHPFDTTKTRLQTAPTGFYSSTMDCIRKTVSREGFAGFYSGMRSPLFGQMFFRAASFSSYKFFSMKLESDTSFRKYLIAGAATGLAISFIEVSQSNNLHNPILNDLIRHDQTLIVFLSLSLKFN